MPTRSPERSHPQVTRNHPPRQRMYPSHFFQFSTD
jgi:hypothetical protein